MTLETLLEAIERRRPKSIDLGLNRVEDVLERLGRPQDQLPPTFHIAGTNGKGSTAAFVRSILEASNKNVHAYTSPHLVRFNERIVLAGIEISDREFIDLIQRVDSAAGENDLTFFEILTCSAILAFSEVRADFLVMEVGLGGRLDATNVIDKPIASIVTPVAFDHMDFLGGSIAQIAKEKAGIFKWGAPAVIGPQSPEAMSVLRAAAESAGATPFAFGSDWACWAEHGRLVYQDQDGLSDLDLPRLAGRHQLFNAGLAVAAVKAARIGPSDEFLSQGLRDAKWPARLQRLKRGPLLESWKGDSSGAEIWLDGGHNPHAGVALAQAMADLEEANPSPLILICGMQINKDIEGFLRAFEGLASAVFAVQSDHSAAAPPAKIAAAAQNIGIPAAEYSDLETAIRAAREQSTSACRILICGSLYLAGDVLRENG